ncbi:MAG: hypothetical protein G8345_19175, partial [Magnetococcales bacterium]|nr:hypothetical protein [Magnetococcales bacterium]
QETRKIAQLGGQQLRQAVEHSQTSNRELIHKVQENNRPYLEQVRTLNLQAVAAMEDITASSRKIAGIITVINDLSFQTNLLALNASVEAARAGEYGRGFAVVATEVKKLAQRSTKAAKAIGQLIENSLLQVEHGTRLVGASNQAVEEMQIQVNALLDNLQRESEQNLQLLLTVVADQLERITNTTATLSDVVEQINVASNEQALGVQQINISIIDMEKITQQNASLVEETAAASRILADQANDLNRAIHGFIFESREGTVPKPAIHPKPHATLSREPTKPPSWNSQKLLDFE